jgi:MoaA/NifB/PqqE/SkfB family radical SAM enzyme
MTKDSLSIRPREEYLKKKWAGIEDQIPVNPQQFSFDPPEREKAYIEAQFPTDEEKKHYHWYREEWYRRAKEYDPGDAPLAVCCELVSMCSLNCSICYTITDEFQMSVVGAQRILPWNIVKNIIDECAELNVPSMLFSWRGESTLYRSVVNGNSYRFPDVLAYARQKGILEITSLTNGHMIDDEMAEAIVDAEPSWISISVDGMGDVYSKIRAPRGNYKAEYNGFERVVNNIKRLIAIREAKGKLRPQIRTNTIFPAIAKNPKAYHDFMESIGVGWITVNELLDFRGTSLDCDGLPDDAVIEKWACQYPFQRLTVSANGIILPCTGAHNEDSELVLGRYRGTEPKTIRNVDGTIAIVNVPETTLREAWHSQKLEHIRMLHKSNRRTEIKPGCQNCRHGAKKHGVEWIPEDWDMEKMEWIGRKWRNG